LYGFSQIDTGQEFEQCGLNRALSLKAQTALRSIPNFRLELQWNEFTNRANFLTKLCQQANINMGESDMDSNLYANRQFDEILNQPCYSVKATLHQLRENFSPARSQPFYNSSFKQNGYVLVVVGCPETNQLLFCSSSIFGLKLREGVGEYTLFDHLGLPPGRTFVIDIIIPQGVIGCDISTQISTPGKPVELLEKEVNEGSKPQINPQSLHFSEDQGGDHETAKIKSITSKRRLSDPIDVYDDNNEDDGNPPNPNNASLSPQAAKTASKSVKPTNNLYKRQKVFDEQDHNDDGENWFDSGAADVSQFATIQSTPKHPQNQSSAPKIFPQPHESIYSTKTHPKIPNRVSDNNKPISFAPVKTTDSGPILTMFDKLNQAQFSANEDSHHQAMEPPNQSEPQSTHHREPLVPAQEGKMSAFQAQVKNSMPNQPPLGAKKQSKAKPMVKHPPTLSQISQFKQSGFVTPGLAGGYPNGFQPPRQQMIRPDNNNFDNNINIHDPNTDHSVGPTNNNNNNSDNNDRENLQYNYFSHQTRNPSIPQTDNYTPNVNPMRDFSTGGQLISSFMNQGGANSDGGYQPRKLSYEPQTPLSAIQFYDRDPADGVNFQQPDQQYYYQHPYQRKQHQNIPLQQLPPQFRHPQQHSFNGNFQPRSFGQSSFNENYSPVQPPLFEYPPQNQQNNGHFHQNSQNGNSSLPERNTNTQKTPFQRVNPQQLNANHRDPNNPRPQSRYGGGFNPLDF
jgi:hypothetical protein